MTATESDQAHHYQDLVLRYEQMGEQIQALLRQYGGHSKDMPTEAITTYRSLATQRDELYDQMKAIEADWLTEENG